MEHAKFIMRENKVHKGKRRGYLPSCVSFGVTHLLVFCLRLLLARTHQRQTHLSSHPQLHASSTLGPNVCKKIENISIFKPFIYFKLYYPSYHWRVCEMLSTQMSLLLGQWSDESIEMEAILLVQNQISATIINNEYLG